MTSLPSRSNVLQMTPRDMQLMLAMSVHIGTKNQTHAMKRYVNSRRKDGVNILDLHMTWEKLTLAARIIAAVDNPKDITLCASRTFAMRPVFKFSQYVGTNYVTGRFIPGTFTNQIQSKFIQPRVLVVADPRTDHQAVNEARLVNIPVIAFCDTDSPLEYVDVAIPCNNHSSFSLAAMYWLLAREVLRLRGEILRTIPWGVKIDMFIHRDLEELKKTEELQRTIEDKEVTVEKADTMRLFERDDENNWDQ